MELEISGSFTGASVQAPPSKSVMQRAVAAALMAKGTSTLFIPSLCNDSLAAIGMAQALGATVAREDSRVLITGGLTPLSASLDAGESGLGVRLFSAVAATYSGWITINGTGTVLKRPMGEVVKYLTGCGAMAESNNGFLPLRVKGPLSGGRAFLDGTSSSQFLTGLLMALPLAEVSSYLTVDSLSSRSYIDITIEVMKHFGVTVENDNYRDFYIPGKQRYSNTDFTIEGDWSGAAFLLVAGALGRGIEVTNLRGASFQPDRQIIDSLKLAGSDIVTTDDSVIVKPVPLKGFTVDVSGAPDLAPPLVALATGCQGVSVITGTERLRIKESDRGEALEREFRKLGFEITNRGTSLIVKGGSRVKGGRCESHGDHRISMALSVAAASSLNGVTLSGYDAVAKSYPGFFDDIRQCGMEVNLIGDEKI
ncbi:MAG: 3-phosphoshikimate 1-carboxyvinyltransferase [Bacteroidales bacterium]|nr:3-phosphoshikimate 1-carboxyvinyltransferase [Bacteroidales bacterium]